jgi:uncharacterized protein (TIGR00251 family)
MIELTITEAAVTFWVRVVPGSSRSEIVGEYGRQLKVKVTAPPVEGAANDELIKFFSKLLRGPRSAVEIVSGRSSRSKVIRVLTGSPAETAAILKAKT